MKQALVSILFTAALATGNANGSRSAFVSAEIWPENNGVNINAHGGGIFFHEGTYYMGNRGDGGLSKSLNWTHRNNQRIGVDIADHPDGPWRRFDKPVLDVSVDPRAPDVLMVSNPTVTQRPGGGFLRCIKGRPNRSRFLLAGR